jgi:hypothetical protein
VSCDSVSWRPPGLPCYCCLELCFGFKSLIWSKWSLFMGLSIDLTWRSFTSRARPTCVLNKSQTLPMRPRPERH